MNTVRAFIAIEMPRLVVDIVRHSQQALERGGVYLRWVRPENVHLTLRFLGDISTGTIAGIRSALEHLAVGVSPFNLQVKGAGVYPGAARPRVVWLGLDGQVDRLVDLYSRLSLLLFQQGIPEENRPFRGHLTIGRVKDRIDADRLKVQMAGLKIIESRPFAVERICLFKSDLKPGGPVYSPLVTVRAGCGVRSPESLK